MPLEDATMYHSVPGQQYLARWIILPLVAGDGENILLEAARMY